MVYEQYKSACKKLNIPFDKYELWKGVAKTLKLSKKANSRLKWIIYYHTKADHNASLTIRHFGLNRSVFYYWFNRFDETDLSTLEDKSTAPLHTRQRKTIHTIEEQRGIKLRKEHMHWGKMKLAKVYEDIYQEKLTSWQFQRIIQDFNLYPKPVKNTKTQVKRQRSLKKKRITELKKKKPVLGYLLHFDSIVIHWNGCKRYIITMIDDFTKIAYARMYKNHSSYSAKDFLNRVNYLLDDRINNIHSDNGSEFQKHFKQLGEQLKLTQYYSRIRTPKDNPSMERFNRTLKYEWLFDGNFNENIDIFNSNLKDFLIEYNFVRPHQTLNYLTPMQFAVKYKQVSERWSSNTPIWAL